MRNYFLREFLSSFSILILIKKQQQQKWNSNGTEAFGAIKKIEKKERVARDKNNRFPLTTRQNFQKKEEIFQQIPENFLNAINNFSKVKTG